MVTNETLLERMASISPGVRLHLEGQLWQQHIDEDEINSTLLVAECFSLMIDEAYELGIEFFCHRDELCSNFYFVDKVLLLFEVLFPVALYRSITEDAGFKRMITAIVADAAGDPDESSVINILSYLAIDHPFATDLFSETYTFLYDKMKSTPVFDNYVLTMLGIDNTPFDVPVDTTVLAAYHEHIAVKTARLIKAIDLLNHKMIVVASALQIQYNRLDIYKNNAVDPEAIRRYAWTHQMITHATHLTPMEQALVLRFAGEFDATTPFYEEYFRIRATPILPEDAISLVLGALDELLTKESFVAQVDAILQRLLVNDSSQIDSYALAQRATMALVQEFYS